MLIGKLRRGSLYHWLYPDFVLGHYGTYCGLGDRRVSKVSDVCIHCGNYASHHVDEKPVPKITCKKCIDILEGVTNNDD
jgi:hypothetical protein